jgi:hypothetical protein
VSEESETVCLYVDEVKAYYSVFVKRTSAWAYILYEVFEDKPYKISVLQSRLVTRSERKA